MSVSEKAPPFASNVVNLDLICYGPNDVACNEFVIALELARNELVSRFNMYATYNVITITPPNYAMSNEFNMLGIYNTSQRELPRIIIGNEKMLSLDLVNGIEEVVEVIVKEVARFTLKFENERGVEGEGLTLRGFEFYLASDTFSALTPEENVSTEEPASEVEGMSSVGETELNDDRIRG